MRRRPRWTRRLAAAVVAAGLLPAAGHAGMARPAARDRKTSAEARREVRAVLQRFNDRLAKVYELLQANRRGADRRALRTCTAILEDLDDTFVDNGVAARFYGYTLFFRAVAKCRLGDEGDAAWDWWVAQAVLPELKAKRYGNFPRCASFLAAHRLGDEKETRDPGSGEGEDVPCGIQPPIPLKRPGPRFPPAAHRTGFTGEAVVAFVIGTDGVPREPRLKRSSGATSADVAALLAVRRWRFRPGAVCGRPTDVFFTLQVQFQRPGG